MKRASIHTLPKEASLMSDRNPGKAILIALAVTSVLAMVLVGVALQSNRNAPVPAMAAQAPTAEYGERLIRETTRYLGQYQPDENMRYSGNSLDCSSCHLVSGSDPGTLSLLETAQRYPRFSGRDGGDRDLRDRINGCMERSMNGRPLDRDSTEMIAMETYILGLNQAWSIMSDTRKVAVEPPAFKEPDRVADLSHGQLVYEAKCQICHGVNGEGLQESADLSDGFVFPPLWGPESYNNGAGMNRVLTAANFIKARMPLGQPDLNDDEAFDVSAYINSKPRPEKTGLETDYPELFRKPVDSPYPPYDDPFPQEQHKYGPFSPIRDFYSSRDNG
jgi:thiosulfate dehydrogenase